MKEGNESAELKNEIHYNKIIYIQLRLFSKTVVKVYNCCKSIRPYKPHKSRRWKRKFAKTKISIISLFQITKKSQKSQN